MQSTHLKKVENGRGGRLGVKEHVQKGVVIKQWCFVKLKKIKNWFSMQVNCVFFFSCGQKGWMSLTLRGKVNCLFFTAACSHDVLVLLVVVQRWWHWRKCN